jgi:hypothetical protein
VSVANEHAFDEIPSQDVLRNVWHEARSRWLALRDHKPSATEEANEQDRQVVDLTNDAESPAVVPFEPAMSDEEGGNETLVGRVAKLRRASTGPSGIVAQ